MALAAALLALVLSGLTDGAVAGIINEVDEEIEQMKPRADGIVEAEDPIFRLNRFSFHKTVLQEDSGNQVENWIVLFCPHWYEPCQALEPAYKQIGAQWQDQLNTGLLTSGVRFAAVDCATEKALCNTQSVGMEYPMVAHYRNQKQVASWRGQSLQTDKRRLGVWLERTLTKKGAGKKQTEAERKEDEDTTAAHQDLLLILTCLLGNAWLISRGTVSGSGSGGSSQAAAGEAPEKPASNLTQSTPADRESVDSAARLLPSEWARDRPSIEL